MKLVLASTSPRRRKLLGTLGLDFAVIASGVPEDLGLAPVELVLHLSEQKARAVGPRANDALIIGADTSIDLDGRELGKPIDEADASRILRLLRNRSHGVVTGVAVLNASTGQLAKSVVSTKVRMRDYSDAEIRAYVESGEPMDKAGAYAIQGLGGALVESIQGCYCNVIGLPLCETVQLLRRQGLRNAFSEPCCQLPNGEPCPRLA